MYTVYELRVIRGICNRLNNLCLEGGSVCVCVYLNNKNKNKIGMRYTHEFGLIFFFFLFLGNKLS